MSAIASDDQGSQVTVQASLTPEEQIANIIAALVERANGPEYPGRLEAVRVIIRQLEETFTQYRAGQLLPLVLADDPFAGSESLAIEVASALQVVLEEQDEDMEQDEETRLPVVALYTDAPRLQPARTYLDTLATGESERTMRIALRNLVQWMAPKGFAITAEAIYAFPWERLRYQHTAAIRKHLLRMVREGVKQRSASGEVTTKKYAVATANKHIRALRGVLKAAWELMLMTTDDYQRAVNIKDIKGKALPRGRMLREGELERLLQGARRHPTIKGCRDLAIVILLWATGLRRSEVVQLDVADYDRERYTLLVRNGKGNAQREGYIEAQAVREALEDWLAVRGSDPGPLFLRIRRGGHIVRAKHVGGDLLSDLEGTTSTDAQEEGDLEMGEEMQPDGRLTDQAIYYIITTLAHMESIWDLTSHDFRRNFISLILVNTGDLSVASGLAGHSQLATTIIYDVRGEGAKRKAAATLTAPAVRWRDA
jgi:site-specific recombinase XerD